MKFAEITSLTAPAQLACPGLRRSTVSAGAVAGRVCGGRSDNCRYLYSWVAGPGPFSAARLLWPEAAVMPSL